MSPESEIKIRYLEFIDSIYFQKYDLIIFTYSKSTVRTLSTVSNLLDVNNIEIRITSV